MTTTAGGDGEKSMSFRCLDVARYVVAAAVTVLIMAVIVNAVKVVLRPESLQLSVVGGSIVSGGRFVTEPPPPQPPEVGLAFNMDLRALNPSGRARMYYVNITAYLFDKNTSASASSTPEDDSIFYIKPHDIAVLQQETVDSLVTAKVTKEQVTPPPYYDMLYNGSSISDVTLRLDGELVTEVNSRLNETRPMTSYYCEQLLVGGDSDDLKGRQDVICRQQGRS